MSKWLWQNRPLLEAPPDQLGFVYSVTNLLTGEFYVGLKGFWSVTNPKLSKKASLAAWSGKGRKPLRAKNTVKESNWKVYCTSSKAVQELVADLGEGKFKWEILEMHDNKTELQVAEALRILEGMCNPLCMNIWLKLTIYKKNLKCNK